MTKAAATAAPWEFGVPPARPLVPVPPGDLASRVSPVPDALVPDIAAEGLVAGAAGGLARLMGSAQGLLPKVRGLDALVRATVDDIHPLAAEPEYDVSHSQPRWKSRIFVSCPERADEVGALRLAESVVHEAMHLHLTAQENRDPFVSRPHASAHSPWRGEDRPVQGVLHGLFVFACVARFLEELTAGTCLSGEGRTHAQCRLATITGELSKVDPQALSSSLTPHGKEAIGTWLAWHRLGGLEAGTWDAGGRP